MRVLITDGDQRSSLAVVRSLGRSGHDVYVCAPEVPSLAGVSRYAVQQIGVPELDCGTQAYLDAVAAAVERHDIDVVIPMTDASATTLLELRSRLPGVDVPFPPAQTYLDVSDKVRLMEAGRELGVPVPPGVVVPAAEASRVELLDRCADWGYPVVVKPGRSVAIRAGSLSRFGVHVALNPTDLERELDSLGAGAYPLLVQKLIRGPGLGVFVLAREGSPVAWFAHRRLREKPPWGGVSVYRESAPVRSDLKALSEQLLHHFRWTGVAMIEFKEDAETGVPYLMEINGRFWGSLQLAIDSGVDFPRLLLESSPPTAPTFRRKIRSRWLWGDVDHLLMVLTRGGSNARPGTPGRMIAILRFLRIWWPGDRFEVLRVSDPRPFLLESRRWFRHLFG